MTERIKKAVISYSNEYAVTITLKPSMYHMTAVMQRNAIQGIINSFTAAVKMSVICELTKSFNIHLHGTIKVNRDALNKSVKGKSPEHQIHDLFRNIKDIGFVCVKPIDDYPHWQQYCLKNYKLTKDELNENPVIRDDNEFFPVWMLHKLEYETEGQASE